MSMKKIFLVLIILVLAFSIVSTAAVAADDTALWQSQRMAARRQSFADAELIKMRLRMTIHMMVRTILMRTQPPLWQHDGQCATFARQRTVI